MITEGTYPYYFGGVSTWCDVLIKGLPEVDFTLMSLVDDPNRKKSYELSPNVVDFRPVSIWGMREIAEVDKSQTFIGLLKRKLASSDADIHMFTGLLRGFLSELFADKCLTQRLALITHRLYRYFQAHDFDAVMKHPATWDCFVQTVQESFPSMAERHGYAGTPYTLADMAQGLRWLHHMLIPLAQRLPKVHVAHAAMAGMCTLVAVAAKLEHGAAFLLTEHGIYLRECYLSEARSTDSLFLKFLRLSFAQKMTELSCMMADQISPCCDYNQRWERRMGATDSQLRTIYYGLDTTAFTPDWKPIGTTPIVIWVGRMNPLKDLKTLLEAAAVVNEVRPEVQFHLFGAPGVGDEKYFAGIQALRDELGLSDTVKFRGFTSNTAEAFNQGDLAVLTSISEGFPYVIVEAMLCGKSVVATRVGGIPEQIEDCGVVVEPRDPRPMADAILSLLNDPDRCLSLGQAARNKAASEFNIQAANGAYRNSYQLLAEHRHANKIVFKKIPATMSTQLAVG